MNRLIPKGVLVILKISVFSIRISNCKSRSICHVSRLEAWVPSLNEWHIPKKSLCSPGSALLACGRWPAAVSAVTNCSVIQPLTKLDKRLLLHLCSHLIKKNSLLCVMFFLTLEKNYPQKSVTAISPHQIFAFIYKNNTTVNWLNLMPSVASGFTSTLKGLYIVHK